MEKRLLLIEENSNTIPGIYINNSKEEINLKTIIKHFLPFISRIEQQVLPRITQYSELKQKKFSTDEKKSLLELELMIRKGKKYSMLEIVDYKIAIKYEDFIADEIKQYMEDEMFILHDSLSLYAD